MKFFSLVLTLFIGLKVLSQPAEGFAVYFKTGKYTIEQAARNQLDSFWNQASKQKLQLRLVGYCDPRGSEAYNKNLSLNRAGEVQRYLLNKGADPANFLSISGAGEHDTLVTLNNEDGWRLNRRVVIQIIRKIEKPSKGNSSLKEVIADSATTKGTNLILRNINFEGGMHIILQESSATLHELLDALRSNPKLQIRIEGHICCEPGPEDGMDNQTGIKNLSEARARAIHDWLISQGIARERLSYAGLGHSKPIYPYPETSEEERKANRRVEITILNK